MEWFSILLIIVTIRGCFATVGLPLRINEVNAVTNAVVDRREFIELEYVDYCLLSRQTHEVTTLLDFIVSKGIQYSLIQTF